MRKPFRIKFLSKTYADKMPCLWSPLIPAKGFDGVKFTFDVEDKDYDFLVIYEGLPKLAHNQSTLHFETLSCSRANTLLITTEPASIRIDGPNFMRQFGHILTSKSHRLTQHPNHIDETPPLRWFYGRPFDSNSKYISVDELAGSVPAKSKNLSTVCSTKQMSHTVHAARLEFVTKLQVRLPELDVFGRGIKPISDKAEAMRDYRYHIAIENHIEAGHWTEKLSDCFLAGALPFYFGDPLYAKVFPEHSVIRIDIFDIDETVRIIKNAIQQDLFSERQPDLTKARKIVLERYNTLGWVARFVRNNFETRPPEANQRIYNRHSFRKHHPFKALSDLAFRTRMASHPDAQPLQHLTTALSSSEP